MDVSKLSIETPVECLKLLQDYIPNEFKHLTIQDICVEIQHGGLVNTLKVVTRKSDNYKVLIRVYGGNSFDIDRFRALRCPLSWQLLIFHELSNIGIGPKLLGVFEEGRIEEFIPSKTLKPQDFENLEIIKDLAKNSAIIHAMKFPFNQNADILMQMMRQWHEHFAKNFDPISFISKYQNGIINCGADFNRYVEVLKYNWMAEGELLRNITDKFQPRIGLILWDNNSLNVLIRENPKVGQLKTCIIDYECCRYDSVVRDIAARFVNRLVDFAGKGKDKATGFKIPDENIRKYFIREYLNEMKLQNKSADQKPEQEMAVQEEEIDQWLFEVDHFILMNLISYIAMTFMADIFLEKDITFVFVALTCYDEYLRWKSHLKSKYGTMD